MSPAEFVGIWEAWDRRMAAMPRRPSERYGREEADRMEAACRAMAPGNVSRFRDALAAARRSGQDYDIALKQVMASTAVGRSGTPLENGKDEWH